VTNNKNSDETGICAGALGLDGDAYILADRSLKAQAERWARTALETCHDYEADRLLGEVNNGGDLVEITIRNVAKSMHVPMPLFYSISASKGKLVRSEPAAAMYQQHRVHHVGYLPGLEDEMTSHVFKQGATRKSPNRIDALTYVVTDLLLQRQGRKLGFSE
jgi:phage terminase large subunit-like protein